MAVLSAALAFAQATHDEYVQAVYPNAKTGFTYMYNFYFPPGGSKSCGA